MRIDTSEIVDAYRADLNRAESESFGDRDGVWLVVGSTLQHAARLPRSEREAYLRRAAESIETVASIGTLAETVRSLADPTDRDAGIARVSAAVATDAENAGAFAVATTILDHARTLLKLSRVLLQGRLLSQQARILRKIGELDVAEEQFEHLVELGQRHGEPELVVHGLVGQAVLARHRGNYPEVRELIRQVFAIPASTPEIASLHAHAHHGMLVAAAVAGDFDTALQHGALAIELAVSPDVRLELLQNLASVCYDIGEFRAALHSSLRVLHESSILRVRMAAYGTAALSAARLREVQAVDALARNADNYLRSKGIEHAITELAREFFEAFAWIGDTERASHYRAIAEERAGRGKYYEILHRLDEFGVPAAHAAPPVIDLSVEARRVADDLRAGNPRQLLAAALGATNS